MDDIRDAVDDLVDDAKKNVAVAEPRMLGKTEEELFKGKSGVKDSVVERDAWWDSARDS